MRVFIRDAGGMKVEAWVEDWIPGTSDFQVVSKAKCIVMGKKCLIDTLDTPVKFQKKGYATAIVKELQKYFDEVAPIGIVPSAVGFWAKFNMTDALGPEDYDETTTL